MLLYVVLVLSGSVENLVKVKLQFFNSTVEYSLFIPVSVGAIHQET